MLVYYIGPTIHVEGVFEYTTCHGFFVRHSCNNGTCVYIQSLLFSHIIISFYVSVSCLVFVYVLVLYSFCIRVVFKTVILFF